jgi:hypothetical protein
VKVTLTTVHNQTESVASRAWRLAVPEVVDFKVKVTAPDVSDGPDAAETVAIGGHPCWRVTVFPGTGLPYGSRSVTANVDVATPSATTLVGEAAAEDCCGDTGPGVKFTDAV